MLLRLNLASRTYVNRRALYGFYAIFGGLLILLLLFNLDYLWRLRAHGGKIAVQLAEVELKLDQRGVADPDIAPDAWERRRREVAFANEILLRDGFRWTEMLDRLEAVALDGISIRVLQPDFKKKSLSLSGDARGVRELRQFIDRLLAAPSFSEVYLLNQSTVKVMDALGGEHQGIAFSIDLKGVF
ncbi:MAG: PilN domain-containing protein [Desulfuromonadales bacterium]